MNVWIRAAVAGALSLCLPGAGHALIRDWVRALLFSGLYVAFLALFLPSEVIAAAEVGAVEEAWTAAYEGLPTLGRFTLMFIVLFAATDATLRATGLSPGTNRGADGPTCPQCGRELDEDLEFCHWCTARLESEAEDDGPVSP